jgi:hypothetical protein
MVAIHARIEREDGSDRDEDQVRDGEAMVFVSDVVNPVVLRDVIVDGSTHWVVTEITETLGGIHRLGIETVARSVRGRGRGNRAGRRY